MARGGYLSGTINGGSGNDNVPGYSGTFKNKVGVEIISGVIEVAMAKNIKRNGISFYTAVFY